MMEFLTGLFNVSAKTIKQVAVIVIALIALLWLVKFIRGKIRGARSRVCDELLGGLTAADIKFAIDQAKNAELDPSPKSISGATNIYLNKILADFPDFHLPEAKASVELLINEYLPIRFEGAKNFVKSEVEASLAKSVRTEEKILNVSDISVHKISISNYIKTNELQRLLIRLRQDTDLRKKKKKTDL